MEDEPGNVDIPFYSVWLPRTAPATGNFSPTTLLSNALGGHILIGDISSVISQGNTTAKHISGHTWRSTATWPAARSCRISVAARTAARMDDWSGAWRDDRALLQRRRRRGRSRLGQEDIHPVEPPGSSGRRRHRIAPMITLRPGPGSRRRRGQRLLVFVIRIEYRPDHGRIRFRLRNRAIRLPGSERSHQMDARRNRVQGGEKRLLWIACALGPLSAGHDQQSGASPASSRCCAR